MNPTARESAVPPDHNQSFHGQLDELDDLFWIIAGMCVAIGLGLFYGEWVANL